MGRPMISRPSINNHPSRSQSGARVQDRQGRHSCEGWELGDSLRHRGSDTGRSIVVSIIVPSLPLPERSSPGPVPWAGPPSEGTTDHPKFRPMRQAELSHKLKISVLPIPTKCGSLTVFGACEKFARNTLSLQALQRTLEVRNRVILWPAVQFASPVLPDSIRGGGSTFACEVSSHGTFVFPVRVRPGSGGVGSLGSGASPASAQAAAPVPSTPFRPPPFRPLRHLRQNRRILATRSRPYSNSYSTTVICWLRSRSWRNTYRGRIPNFPSAHADVSIPFFAANQSIDPRPPSVGRGSQIGPERP